MNLQKIYLEVRLQKIEIVERVPTPPVHKCFVHLPPLSKGFKKTRFDLNSLRYDTSTRSLNPMLWKSIKKEDLEKVSNKKLLTTKQIQRMFDVSYTTIANWRRYGHFPCVILAGSNKMKPVRFDEGVTLFWARLNSKTIVHKDYKDDEWA